MTAAVPEGFLSPAKETKKYQFNRSTLDNVEASEKVSSISCTAVVQQQVSTDPSECHAVMFIAIWFCSCCFYEPVGALFSYNSFVFYSNRLCFLF